IIEGEYDQRQDRSVQQHKNKNQINSLYDLFHQNAAPSPSLSYFCIIAILIRINTISTRESPLPTFQLFPCLNFCSITFPMRRILLPPSRSLITKVVREGTNTMVIPLMTPGRLKGKVILQKV